MDFEGGSGSSLSLSVENSEEINHEDKLGNIGEAKFQGNEPSEVENLENLELRCNEKDKEVEALWDSASSASVEMKYQVSSPSSPSVKKGFGLKKWKRLPRDVSKRQDSHTETGNMVIEELTNSVANPTKRGPLSAERQRKTEDPFSPPSSVVGRLDAFSLLDTGLVASPDIDAGTSSQNGQDQSSNSSTAASVAKINYDIPLVVGIANDKSRMSLSGKNSGHSLHRGQQGRGRIQTIIKHRGERVKIEKENSHSSMESDSRSSNIQAIYTTRNGTLGEVSTHHDEENDDDLQDSLKQVGDAPRRDDGIDCLGGSQEILPEDEVTELSLEVKNDRFQNHCSHGDQEPLAENELRAAQEALAKELRLIKEISIDACMDDAVSDNHPGLPDTENKLHDNIYVHSPSGGATQSSSLMAKETEDLFKKRMESEVIYLIISGKVQELRSKSMAHASMQTRIHDKLVDPGIKVLLQKKKVVEFENLARVEETLKLQKRVRKYTSCFVVQLLLLVIILGVVVFQSLPNMEIVPT